MLPGRDMYDVNRMRSTLMQKASHQTVDPMGGGSGGKGTRGGAQPLTQLAMPSLSPEQTANSYAQQAALVQQFQLQAAALRQQRTGIRADARNQFAANKAQGIQDITAAQDNAMQRGLMGSSIQAVNMSAARAGWKTANEQVRAQEIQQLAQNQLQRQEGALQLYQGQTALQAQNLATQQSSLAQMLQQNLVNSGRESNFNALQKFYQGLGG